MDKTIVGSYQQDLIDAGQSSLPWELLSGKNILITGASGLIGFCLVEVLLRRKEKDYFVYVSGRDENKLRTLFKNYLGDEHLYFLAYDVTTTMNSDVAFQYIIHAASGASPQLYTSDPVGVMKANIMGVDNLLSYGVNHGLKRFLYVSSGEVYGEGDGRVFDESFCGYVDCVSVRACYPSSKRAAETLCISYAHQYGISVSIARPCHVYGPYFNKTDQRVFAQFFRNVGRHEDIVLKSDGKQLRSWCYVVDCAKALLFVLLKGDNCNAYNIADPNSNITIRDFAEMVSRIGKLDLFFSQSTDDERKGYSVVSRSVFDTSKIVSLGFTITGTMENKIMKSLNEYNSIFSSK